MPVPTVTRLLDTAAILDDFVRDGVGYQQFGLKGGGGKAISRLLEVEDPSWREHRTWEGFWEVFSHCSLEYLTGELCLSRQEAAVKLQHWLKLETTLNAMWLYGFQSLPPHVRIKLLRGTSVLPQGHAHHEVVACGLEHYFRIIKPDALLYAGGSLISIEMKVNARGGSRSHKYSANQHLKYVRLATSWHELSDAPTVNEFRHVVLRPAQAPIEKTVKTAGAWIAMREPSEGQMVVDLDRCLARLKTQKDWWQENVDDARQVARRTPLFLKDYEGFVRCLERVPCDPVSEEVLRLWRTHRDYASDGLTRQTP